MSFTKKIITNELILRLYDEGGCLPVIELYRRYADATITDDGLSSRLRGVVNELDYSQNLTKVVESLILDYKSSITNSDK